MYQALKKKSISDEIQTMKGCAGALKIRDPIYGAFSLTSRYQIQNRIWDNIIVID